MCMYGCYPIPFTRKGSVPTEADNILSRREKRGRNSIIYIFIDCMNIITPVCVSQRSVYSPPHPPLSPPSILHLIPSLPLYP